MPQLSHLEVILKTVERCNLNCSYCYFFNGSDLSYKDHPPFIKKETIDDLAHFLDRACNDYPIQNLVIDIHGGEPTLQRKKDFDEMCCRIKQTLHSNVNLRFKIQTNGTLITNDWIELFSRHNVSVGVSLDGPQKENDLHRVNHAGKGSYSEVKKGIELLSDAFANQRIPSLGILCVINPIHNAKKILHHFVQDLKICAMDFLIPDHNHNTFKLQKNTPEKLGNFLCDLFEAWVELNDPNIKIRIIDSVLSSLMGGEHIIMGMNHKVSEYLAITIASNGDLSGDDALRSSVPTQIKYKNIKTTSLKEFINFSNLNFLRSALNTLPSACANCCWSKICGGGMANNRYSHDNAFDNPSVYCNGLKMWYQKIANYLIENGFPREKLRTILI